MSRAHTPALRPPASRIVNRTVGRGVYTTALRKVNIRRTLVAIPFSLLLLSVLGQVTEKVDGVPDVFVAQFLAPWFHDHGFGPDPFLDTLEDLRVGAAVFPFAGGQVGRGRTLGRGRPIAFALQPVTTGAVLGIDGPAGLDRIG